MKEVSTTDRQPTSAETEQAAEWYWRLCEADVTSEEIARWQAWLRESARNYQAFASIEAILRQVDKATDLPWPSDEQLLQDDYDGSIPVTDWLERQSRNRLAATILRPFKRLLPPSAPGLPKRWLFAASLLLAIVMLPVGQYAVRTNAGAGPEPDFAIYMTDPAEHRRVRLPDGSYVYLSGKSVVSVAYSRESRLVILERGAAYFEVAENKQRPFYVQAGSRRIVAVGTAFNVARQDDRVVVTVTEGEILISPKPTPAHQGKPATTSVAPDQSGTARLLAGQQTIYNETELTPVTIADPLEAIAWREGRLKYRGEALRYVVEDVNRYTSKPIALADASTAELLFTGTVFQDRIQAWLAGLQQSFPVAIEEAPDRIVIHKAPQN